MMKKLLAIFSVIALLAIGFSPVMSVAAEEIVQEKEGIYTYDIVIYGGNASGIVAAIQAAKMGKTVAVVEPNAYRIGGLTTGGLSDTDIGNAGVIGGLSYEFYQRVGKKYNKSTDFTFEPKVALEVLEEWIAEYPDNITVFMNERLDLADGVEKNGTDIVSITTESGKVFKAKMFLDCSYEGDLMAKADVSYTIGRESNAVYGETLNGITAADNNHNGVPTGISPYVIQNDPSSGLLPGVSEDFGGKTGDGDDKIQAYNFRWTLTNRSDNQAETSEPENYDESRYELLFRAFEANPNWTLDKIFKTTRWLKNGKVDANNNSGISTDLIGGNYNYPEGDYETREKIVKAHEDYQRGLLWALQTSDRIPENIRTEAQKWGLAADEFTENNNWPTQLYVREARRMVSHFVMTQHVCKAGSSVIVSDSVGMGSYSMDSHHIQYVVKNGEVRAEGDFYAPTSPYAISYRSIVPKANECTNLLVPVCLSASHAAYGSIRMEPVFMVLGQSAATAACLAIDENVIVQDVNYNRLKERLTADKQVLYTNNAGTKPGQTGGMGSDMDTTVYPVETLEYTTAHVTTGSGKTPLEYGIYEVSYATAPATDYNRVKSETIGDFIQFEIDVPAAGTYTVSAETYLHQTRAKYKLYLPDQQIYLGEEKDQYCDYDTSQIYDSADRIQLDTFGDVTVANAGKLKLRFEVTGKNAASTGYSMAFCDIQLKNVADNTVTVIPVKGLPTTTVPESTSEAVESGLYDTSFAMAPSTKYQRLLTSAVGDYVEYTLSLPTAGTYTLGAQTYTQKGRGTYRVYLPDSGVYLGETYDQYGVADTDSADRIVTDIFGEVTVTEPKTIRVRFEVAGKNTSSTGYSLAFCNLLVGTPAEESVTGIVTVDSNGGCLVADTTFDTATGKVKHPQTPQREGYRLEGWYTNIDLTETFDFETDTADSDTTLYAKWVSVIPETYTVSFKTNYGQGGSSTGSQHIAADGLVTLPREPQWEDHTFVGWYADAAYTTAWNFAEDMVTADTVLYAKWSASNFAELNNLIELAERQSADDYTPEDFAAFAAALTAAKEVQANPEADQQTIDSVKERLQAAYDELMTKEPIKDDTGDVLLSSAEVISAESHTMTASISFPTPVNLDAYGTRESVALSLKMRINQLDAFPELFRDVSGKEWITYITNGYITLYSGDTKVNMTTISSEYKLSCGTGLLKEALPDEYVTITVPLPDAILETGRLTKVEVLIYNDLHKLAAKLDPDHAADYTINNVGNKGVSLSIKDVSLHLGDKVDTSALEKAIADAKAEVVKTDVYTVDSLTVLQRAIITGETQMKNQIMTQTDVDEALRTIQQALQLLEPISTAVVYGDTNLNGTVTAEDALMALQAATGKVELTSRQITAANVDGEGDVTANDALLILQHATQKIGAFPIES